MYTFHQLPDLPPDHTGFTIVVAILITLLLLVLMADREFFFELFFGATCITAMAYFTSFVWTDQTVVHRENKPVVATFVAFQPEGYREQTGKTRSDKHYMYVVYNVNGQNLIFETGGQTAYPEKATLYYNEK